MENKIKHLEMIQGVINRMAHCSFLLKGWSVLIISALLALSIKDCEKGFVIVALLPAFVFWVLDGFYLWQERLYRVLYDEVRIKNEGDIDFSMKTKECEKKINSWFGALFSSTIIIFHLCVFVIIVAMILKINNHVPVIK